MAKKNVHPPKNTRNSLACLGSNPFRTSLSVLPELSCGAHWWLCNTAPDLTWWGISGTEKWVLGHLAFLCLWCFSLCTPLGVVFRVSSNSISLFSLRGPHAFDLCHLIFQTIARISLVIVTVASMRLRLKWCLGHFHSVTYVTRFGRKDSYIAIRGAPLLVLCCTACCILHSFLSSFSRKRWHTSMVLKSILRHGKTESRSNIIGCTQHSDRCTFGSM